MGVSSCGRPPCPWESASPFLRQPGCQMTDLIRSFAPPPLGGFAFVGKGLPLYKLGHPRSNCDARIQPHGNVTVDRVDTDRENRIQRKTSHPGNTSRVLEA